MKKAENNEGTVNEALATIGDYHSKYAGLSLLAAAAEIGGGLALGGLLLAAGPVAGPILGFAAIMAGSLTPLASTSKMADAIYDLERKHTPKQRLARQILHNAAKAGDLDVQKQLVIDRHGKSRGYGFTIIDKQPPTDKQTPRAVSWTFGAGKLGGMEEADLLVAEAQGRAPKIGATLRM